LSGAAQSARALLRELFAAAVDAVSADAAIGYSIERGLVPHGARCGVLAAGKAAHAMARAWQLRLGAPLSGLSVAREASHVPAPWQALVGGHPLPTEDSARAGRAALAFASQAEPVLVVLLSGGASALLSSPLPGLTLADLRATTELLLRSGAEIAELNCVRKHLAAVGGGRLAAAATRAEEIVVLAISDVLGDDLATIGSGPCAPDPTTYPEAAEVLRARAIWDQVPRAVRAQLERGVAGRAPESPKPGDACFARVRHHVLASNATALAALEACARARGLAVVREHEPLRGEARAVGAALARRALTLRGDAPAVLLAGGETTVRVRGDGRGGRCQEIALAAARVLAGERGVTLLAAGTDGSDGPTDAAGAFADGATLARGLAAGEVADAALARSDAYGFFDREGGLGRTGPTGTNALDIVLALVEPRATS
jgi:glycerate-2-kinase